MSDPSHSDDKRAVMRGYSASDRTTVTWVSALLVALVGLGVLYFAWNSEEEVTSMPAAPHQQTQPATPANQGTATTGSSSSASPATPSNADSAPSR